ncbi:MAG: hypothetical protein E2O58_09765 [Gammaproteobacteria bacterium]|nr:MAG: hypothetical protein E2O58_09765 [Gammaproteobacteria bacterium]
MKKLMLSAVLVLVAPPYGHAEEGLMDGLSLLVACKSENTIQHSSCLGYLVGVAEAAVDSRDSFPGVASNIYISFGDVCMPQSVMQIDLESAFVDWTIAHPELLQSPAANLVLSAYAHTWPCGYEQPGEPGEEIAQVST